MTDAVLATLYDKRSHFTGERCLSLYADRVEVTRAGRVETRLDLSEVERVRMSVEPAGGGVQVVCRISAGRDRMIALGSLTSVGPRRWANNALAFKTFVTALHRALAPRRDKIAFLEGQPLALRLVVSGLGLIIFNAALVWAYAFIIVRENAVLGFIALPFLLVGAALIWVFRPMPAQGYDPEALIARMERGSAMAGPASALPGPD